LLHRHGFHQLLELFLAGLKRFEQGLPLRLQLGEGLLDPLILGTVLFQFLLQFQQPFLILFELGAPLLLLFLQGGDLALKLEPALAALALLFHPGAGAARHITESASRHLHRSLRFLAGALRCRQGIRVGTLLQRLRAVLEGPATVGEVMALALQLFSLLFVLGGLTFQLPALTVQAGQFGLDGQQFVFAEIFDFFLEGLQVCGGFAEGLFGGRQCFAVAYLLFPQAAMPLLQIPQRGLGRLVGQHELLLASLLHLGPQGLVGACFGAVFLEPLAC